MPQFINSFRAVAAASPLALLAPDDGAVPEEWRRPRR